MPPLKKTGDATMIRFALSIPEGSQTLKEKGWKATGNSGF